MSDFAGPPEPSSTGVKTPRYRDPSWRSFLIERRTDYTRVIVTLTLVATFIAALCFGAWASVRPDPTWTHVKEYLNAALPTITGLLGSAMGFYFGSATTNTFQLRPPESATGEQTTSEKPTNV